YTPNALMATTSMLRCTRPARVHVLRRHASTANASSATSATTIAIAITPAASICHGTPNCSPVGAAALAPSHISTRYVTTSTEATRATTAARRHIGTTRGALARLLTCRSRGARMNVMRESTAASATTANVGCAVSNQPTLRYVWRPGKGNTVTAARMSPTLSATNAIVSLPALRYSRGATSTNRSPNTLIDPSSSALTVSGGFRRAPAFS